jgi:hypothetical protein
MGTKIRLTVAAVARGVQHMLDNGCGTAALLVRRDGSFEVWAAPDGRPWLAVGYSLIEGTSKRAVERTARELINRAAEHLERYPAAADVNIESVRGGL